MPRYELVVENGGRDPFKLRDLAAGRLEGREFVAADDDEADDFADTRFRAWIRESCARGEIVSDRWGETTGLDTLAVYARRIS